MKHSEETAAIVAKAEREDPSSKKPKASLGQAKVKVSESVSERAARFFALHGMQKIGHLLGDELSTSAEEQALKEHAEAQAKIFKGSSSSAAPLDDDFDIPEDDNAMDYKKQWAAVDALKKRKGL